jgi:hypothetical protein
MPSQALSEHRRRQRALGLRRVEVQVPEGDAPLVRAVAAALSDPTRAGAIRAVLRERFAPGPSLKTLLEAAPLEGIPLDRASDTGRAVDL